MSQSNFVGRVLILALTLTAALVSQSCDGSGGFGMGSDYPARWGGGSSSPPVFVGGPSR